MLSALVSTYLDRNYILLLQTSSLFARLFYLGLEPKREKQGGGKDVGKLGKLKLVCNGICFAELPQW